MQARSELLNSPLNAVSGFLGVQHPGRLPHGNLTHQTLTALTLHHAGSVRKAATSAASSCISLLPRHCTPLVDALLHWLQDPGSVPQLSDPSAADDSSLPTKSITSARFVAALLAVTPSRQPPGPPSGNSSKADARAGAKGAPPPEAQPDAQEAASADQSRIPAPPEVLVKLMLAAHHPTVTSGRTRARSAWPSVRHQLHPEPRAWLAESPEVAISALLGTDGLASSRVSTQKAACEALGCVMAEASDLAFPALMIALQRQLSTEEHDALSSNDIRILNTPEGAPACLLGG